MSDASRPTVLPPRPSLEQLRKQAKELLAAARAGEPAAVGRFAAGRPPRATSAPSRPVRLADAQRVLAREHGFASWAELARHVEEVRAGGLPAWEHLATSLARAYTDGDPEAVKRLNLLHGTSFFHGRDPGALRRRLTRWWASESRDPELATADARFLVARKLGFADWAALARSAAAVSGASGAEPTLHPPTPRPRSSFEALPPSFHLDEGSDTLHARGPASTADWDAALAVMKERGTTGVQAAGPLDDRVLARIGALGGLRRLHLDGARLSDDGLLHLRGHPRLVDLELGGQESPVTDRGLAVLADLPALRRFRVCWARRVTDAGIAHLAACEALERVDLMGSTTGDGAVRALVGKRRLRDLRTGRQLTDAGLALLAEVPAFATWQGGEPRYGLMDFDAGPTFLLIDGPFTDAGLAGLVRLEGLFGLSLFVHATAFTGGGLAALAGLPRLGFLGCPGERVDDRAMEAIGSVPRLRMLQAQGTVATDDGFRALARSRSLEHLWGRECPNLGGRGLAALSRMPALKGLAVSLKRVRDRELALLPRFPALRELMPMDVTDDGFRHVGRCEGLEALWCMYCRDTGDAATAHLAGLSRLRLYYAGSTRITDRSLRVLAGIRSLEEVRLWDCVGVTDAGVAALAALPRLRRVVLEGLPRVTPAGPGALPAGVQVERSG